MRAAAVLLAACLGACALPGAKLAIPPHLDAVRPDDVAADRPSLGVLRFVDKRPSSSRQGTTPSWSMAEWGFARAGEEQTGDESFREPVVPAMGRDAIATLLRSGAFSEVRQVGSVRDASDADLVLVAVVEELVGVQFRSTSLSLLRLGWYRRRVDDPIGIARVHFRLYATGGDVVWEERIETWRKRPGESIGRAALDAMAVTNEKLAHRVYRQLAPIVSARGAETRDLPLVVLDGCALGSKTAVRRVSDASEILEREADIRLVPRIETWLPPDLGSAEEMLAHVGGLAPARAGALLAFAPLSSDDDELLRGAGTGLARQLGAHALVTCRPDQPAHPTTVAHEVAHLFGAVHVRDRASLMNPLTEFDARFLDPLNRRILRAARRRPFGRPLPPALAAQLEEIYTSAGSLDATRAVDLETARSALQAGSPR